MDPRATAGARGSLASTVNGLAAFVTSRAVDASGGTYHGVLCRLLALAARRLPRKTGFEDGTERALTRADGPPAPQRSASPSSATATSMKRPAEGRRMLTIKLNCPTRTTNKNGASQPSRPPAPTAGVLPRNGQPNAAPAPRGTRQKTAPKIRARGRRGRAAARCLRAPRRAGPTRQRLPRLCSRTPRARANPPLFERPTARRLTSSRKNRSPSSRRPSPCSTRTAMARSRRRSSAR